jgi:hypothetical protein
MNAPVDMSRFIEAKSDQIGADDLIGGPRTFTVRGVTANEGEQPVNVWLEGEERVFRPCKTIRRVMVAMWGADANQYVGRSMTLYRDAEVQFGGMKVGGLRISHMSHIDGARDVVVMKSKGKKAGMKILPLATNARPPALPSPPAPSAGDPVPPQTVELPATAQDWIAETMRQVAACETIADLAELQAGKAKGLSRLEAFPKAHADVVALFNDRRAAVEGAESPPF